MRVLHITATHLGLVGGVPLMLKELITEQNRIDGFEARLLSINADINDCNCIYFDYLGNNRIEDYISSYTPNVVILHSFFHVEYVKVYSVLRKMKIPYYIEPHGSFIKKAFKKSRIKKYIANHTLFYGLIKHAYGYIYLCDGERKNSIYHKEKDIIIPNGIRHSEIVVKSNHTPRLYYIGRFDIHEKGIDALFDALRILDDEGLKFDLDFFGTGTKNEISYIEHSANLLRNIKVCNRGPIYGEEKQLVISRYDIMVLLSRHEGFSMAILEAWNFGIPCIVSPETNVGDITTANALGWVSDLDPKSISITIKHAISDYLLSKDKYCITCNEYVLKNHQWDYLAKLSYSLLNSNV